MINLIFGLPGSGKTTFLAYLALNFLKKGTYKKVYSNVALVGDPVFESDEFVLINSSDIGKYDISEGVVFIDEAMIAWNTRAYAKFSEALVQYFAMSRHYHVDIWLFSQRFDGLDKNIRALTNRVYFAEKKFLTGKWFTNICRVPYKIIFPDERSQKVGEIIQGYEKPPWYCRLAAKHLYRPKYYKYFDSWEAPKLPPIPQRRTSCNRYSSGL